MKTQTQPNQHQQNRSMRPDYRVWFVSEEPNGQALWTEVAALWPTKSGKGYHGPVQTPIPHTEGRLVTMPVQDKKPSQ